MTNDPNGLDLLAIAQEAQVEILAAETVAVVDAPLDDAASSFATAELGYYEAELRSLRDAATRLNEAEHPPDGTTP
jgi:hypothetical protein